MKKLLVLVTAVSIIGYTVETQIENYKLSRLIGGQVCKTIGDGDPSCKSATYTVSGFVNGKTQCSFASADKYHCNEGKGQVAVDSEDKDLESEQTSSTPCDYADKWVCRDVATPPTIGDFRWIQLPEEEDKCGTKAVLKAAIVAATTQCPKKPTSSE